MKTYIKNILAIIAFSAQSFSTVSCDLLVDNRSNDKPIWQTSISDGSLTFASLPVSETDYGVIFAGQKGSKQSIVCIDKNSGKSLWEWTDYFQNQGNINIDGFHFYQQTLAAYNIGSIYAIDLLTGKSVWRLANRGSGIAGLSGISKTFFYANDTTIEQGTMNDGNTGLIFSVSSRTGYRTIVDAPSPFIAANGDTMLVTTRGGLRLSDATTIPTSLILYNLSQRRIVYDSLQEKNSNAGLPIIIGDKIYLALGATIQCNDLWTGKLLWQRTFDKGGFLYNGWTVSDDKIFAASEDLNFYCLEAQTGITKWQINNVAGGVYKPFVMNGVVYFTRTYLYAVDINSGQILWKRECPEQAQNGSVYFFGRVTGSEGKIYVQSYKSAYCYKAAR